MKKTILFSSILAISFSSLAQTKSTDSPPSGITYGVKAGMTIDNFRTSGTKFGALPGIAIGTFAAAHITSFYIGGTVTMPIERGYSLQSGLSLIGKGSTLTYDVGSLNFFSANYEAIIATKYTPWYLEIPLNLVADMDFGGGKFIYGIGPFIGFGIAGKLDRTVTVTSADPTLKTSTENSLTTLGYTTESRSLKFGSDKDMRLIDWGFNVLLGYQLKNGLGIDAGYTYNFANVLADQPGGGDVKAFNGTVSFGLSYAFK